MLLFYGYFLLMGTTTRLKWEGRKNRLCNQSYFSASFFFVWIAKLSEEKKQESKEKVSPEKQQRAKNVSPSVEEHHSKTTAENFSCGDQKTIINSKNLVFSRKKESVATEEPWTLTSVIQKDNLHHNSEVFWRLQLNTLTVAIRKQSQILNLWRFGVRNLRVFS